jgi:hypothetical protein
VYALNLTFGGITQLTFYNTLTQFGYVALILTWVVKHTMVKMANNGNATIHHDLVLRRQAELLCPLLAKKMILMKLFIQLLDAAKHAAAYST